MLGAALALGALANEPSRWHIGSPASDARVAAQNIDVMPDGQGLPDGSGSPEQGLAVYERHCIACHGARGQGGQFGDLAGAPMYEPRLLAADKQLKRTVGNYWPYATSVFDYIRRAMPYDSPGSLSADDLYAVVAYILYENGLIAWQQVMDRASLPHVAMPAKGFYRDARWYNAGADDLGSLDAAPVRQVATDDNPSEDTSRSADD